MTASAKTTAAVLLALVLVRATAACAATPAILAAENVYGQVAAAIAGPSATTTSILTRPNQDPHDFEATPSAARAASSATIVIVNGAGYDPWMDHLLAASPNPARTEINIAALMHTAPGANPHLWYDPATMPRFAHALATALIAQAPGATAEINQRLETFLANTAKLQTQIAAMRASWAATPVTATEPLFGYMARALGLTMRNERFQLAVMNGTEPRISDVAAMENDLRTHQVRVLLYNTQVTDPATARLRAIATQSGVPLVGITETMPPGTTYADWIGGELQALDSALKQSASQ